MEGTAWAKDKRPSDEKGAGVSSDSLALALPSERQKWNRQELLLRVQRQQMFLSETDCFNLQHSILNGSPRTSPNEKIHNKARLLKFLLWSPLCWISSRASGFRPETWWRQVSNRWVGSKAGWMQSIICSAVTGSHPRAIPQLDVPGAGLLYPAEDALAKQRWRPRQRCQWRQSKEDVSQSLMNPSTTASSGTAVDSHPYCNKMQWRVRLGANRNAIRGKSWNMDETPRKLIPAPRGRYWKDSPVWIRV